MGVLTRAIALLCIGVAAAQTAGTSRNITLASGRTYLLHVPADYNASCSHPLVLSFHGADGTSTKQERLSQLSTDGLKIGGLPILAAYPQGVPNTTAGHSATWYSAPYANNTVDDVQFTKDILTDVSANFSVNPARIYASGKSNGGGFTAYLACRPDTSLIFAAFAPVSPALYPESLAFSGCNPSRPIPLINSHGVVDQTIPFYGRNDSKTGLYGVGTSTINVPQWREEWAIRNGCPNGNATRTTMPYNQTIEQVWRCDEPVEAFTVANLGHSWPTTLGLDTSGGINSTASFNLTAPKLVHFFSQHSLNLDCD
ncbi:polyhydroxybutyrate depolymerase, partial [Tremellales sp. Uapishka_1]